MSDIGDAEGDVVAYCMKLAHGTRIMPEGAITGMQLLFNGEAYMMTGLVDLTVINIQAGDYGGELDSGGQDGMSGVFPRSVSMRGGDARC